MADWFEDSLNLDLNLEPVSDPSLEESVGIVGRLSPALQMHLRQRTGQRLRWRHSQSPLEEDRSLELVVDAGENGGGSSQVEEGSVVPEERSCEVLKTCEHNVTSLESGLVQEKENAEKSITESGSFFDCNICLDLAKEPIVTSCGHLFCWFCIYRWLHIHSDAKVCPVCKGEVTLKNVTPIYGRGGHAHEIEEDLGVKIPARPSGRRVESLRQTIQRTSSTFPMDEMIRRLGARFELTGDFLQLLPAIGVSEERARERVARILTLRALQGQQASYGGNSEANARARVDRIIGLQELQAQQASPEADSEANARAWINSILLRELYGQPVSSEGDSEANARARFNSIIAHRELQAMQASFLSQENVVDLTRDNPEIRLPPRAYRRGQSHRSSYGVTPTSGRPSGRRVESLRQTIQRTSSTFPMDEMIRRLGARFELTGDFLQLLPAIGVSEERARERVARILTLRALQGQQASYGGNSEANARARVDRIIGLQELQAQQASPEADSEANARAWINSILLRELYGQPVSSEGDSEANARARFNSIIAHRELQAMQASFLSQENVVDLTRDNPEIRLPPRAYRRGQSHRSSYGVTPTHRFAESYLRRSPSVRSQEMQPSLVDDRDSFSSIAAVTHGESQTVSNTIEIDSRGPEMDSVDSRTPRRRRRLN